MSLNWQKNFGFQRAFHGPGKACDFFSGIRFEKKVLIFQKKQSIGVKRYSKVGWINWLC
jgi:hypothetical protein